MEEKAFGVTELHVEASGKASARCIYITPIPNDYISLMWNTDYDTELNELLRPALDYIIGKMPTLSWP